MSGLSELLADHDVGHAPPTARWPGVYPALVTDIVDPDGQGRVKVSLPWSPDGGGGGYQAWARLATLAGGPNRGSWFVPEHGDEVLVAFEAGDPRRPYVLGGLWNGSDTPPQSMDGAGNNYKKVLQDAQRGHGHARRHRRQRAADARDAGRPEDDARRRPGLDHAPGRQRQLDQARLQRGHASQPAAKLTVNAATAEVSAATLTVNAGMSTFSGVVQADTVITNSVVSTSYTPGAGNIW